MKYNSLYRIVMIVSMALKFLLQIIWFNWTHRVSDETTKRKWEALLSSQAQVYRKKAVKLEGLLIKVGQFLSTRADLLPDVFIRELEGLVDRVDAVPFELSKQTLVSEWGYPIHETLESISDHAVASASIGEVYKAKLYSGEEVAIKIQRHRVEEIFHTDFKALKIVFWLFNHLTNIGKKADLASLYKEMVSTMSQELDFKQELQYGLYFKERYKNRPDIYVPDFYEELSTRKVLVMEWIEGAKITDRAFIRQHHIDREQLAKRLFNIFVDQFLYQGYFQADPHPGNLLLKSDSTIVMIDFGMIGEVKKQDTAYIRDMIKGFVFDDYDAVVSSLKLMNFLLPQTNEKKVKKVISDAATIYLSNDGTKFDSDTLNSILEDLRIIVKEQPIQLPADYAFLGRAANIVIGVLTAIYPQIDLKEWGEPVVKEWITGKDQSNFSFYKEVIKDSAKPLLSLPQSIINALNDGDKDRELKEELFYQSSLQRFYSLFTTLAFILFVVGLSIGLLGELLIKPFMVYLGGGLTVLSCLLLIRFFFKYLNIIKQGGYRK